MNQNLDIGKSKSKLVLSCFLFLFLLAGTFMAGAFIEDKIYFLGDEVKIDMSNYVDYSLRIETPTKKLIKDGSGDVLLFNLDEVGTYNFKLTVGEDVLKYSLLVSEYEKVDVEIIDEEPKEETLSIKDWEEEEKEVSIRKRVVEEEPESEVLGGKFASKGLSADIKVDSEVSWNRKFNLTEEKVSIEIPYVAENVTVNGEMVEVESSIYSKVVSIFSDSLATQEVVIENMSGEIELNYTTPAPEKTERKINDKKKEIVISAPDYLGYKDVYTTTKVDESVSSKRELKVFWKEENKYLDFEVNDSDGNGLIDEVSFIVPHLSTQTFEISINVLDVQSYPYVGGTWRARFDTIGAADLYIRAINGTTFGEDESDDLKFSELKCGEEDVAYEFIDGEVFVGNYSCNETGYETSLVMTSGKHYLEFQFGEEFGYAQNDAVDYTPQTCTNYWGFDCGAGPAESGDNTFDSCSNGVGSDESVEDVLLNGTIVHPGDVLEVTCRFDPYDSSDEEYIYVYDGSWTQIYSGSSTGSSNHDVTKTFTVSSNMGDQWVRCIIDYDGENDECASGSWYDNDDLKFRVVPGNQAPVISSTVLNSTFGENGTTEDLTCNALVSDSDGDTVSLIYDWMKSGVSIFKTLAPFEIGSTNVLTKDYSGSLGYDLIASATYDKTGGYDGFGAYTFDGSSQSISLDNAGGSSSIYDGVVTERTVFLRYYANDVSGSAYRVLFEEGGGVNGLDMYIQNGNLYAGAWSEGTGWNGNWASTPTTSGVWHAAALVFDGTNSLVSVYHDGAFVTVSGSNQVAAHTGNDYLGYTDGTVASPNSGTDIGAGAYFTGKIDDFMVLDIALSKAQLDSMRINGMATLVSDETNIGDIFSCKATPNDGSLEGVFSMSNSLTVVSSNAAPSVTAQINTTDGSNFPGSDLNCFGTLIDPENSPMGVRVTWYKNGIQDSYSDYNNGYVSGTLFSASLDSSNTAAGEDWSCSLMVFDGEKDYTSTSSDLTILSPPLDYGMYLKFSDTFTGSNGNLYSHSPDLGNSWTEVYNRASGLIITGNSLDATGNRNGGAAAIGEISGSWNADQMVTATYSAQDDSDDLSHLIVRADSDMSNAYIFSFSITAANTRIWKRSGGGNTVLQSNCGAGSQFTTGDVVTLKVTGNLIEVFDGLNLVCSATDSSVVSGSPGIGIGASYLETSGDQSNQRLDNVLMYSANNLPTLNVPAMVSVNGPNDDRTDYECSALVNDIDMESLNAEIRWYKNGAIDSVVVSNGLSSGDSFIKTLSGSRTSVGETWKCSARVYDGKDYSNWQDSNEITTVAYVVPPRIDLTVVSPLGDVNVYQNEMFNVTVKVDCLDANCGTVDVVMDPIVDSSESFESSEGGFTHASVSGGVDDWHRENNAAHDGSFSFKAGGAGSATYSSNANSYLQTPTYDIVANSTFSFRHFVDSEPGYDGGKLEYSEDGGAWTKVTSFKSGDYNSDFNNWNNIVGFENERAWTGTIGSAGSFQLVEVDMDSFFGSTIAFRFRFGSDTNAEQEGWYVDSVKFTTEVEGGTKGVIPMNSGSPFYTTTQNPFTTSSLNMGQSETIVYNINATGGLDETYEFFSYANLTSTPATGDITSKWNVTIKENVKPVAIIINSLPGTIRDLTPLLNVTLSDRQAETLWYNINGGASEVLCSNCIGEVTKELDMFSEGDFTLNVFANNSNGDITNEAVSFTIDLQNNFYDSFVLNETILDFGDSIWEAGSLNYTIVPINFIGEDFESEPLELTDIVDGTGGSCSWFRDSGGTNSGNTGPSTGHSGSYYIYMETSNGACETAGETAITETNSFNLDGEEVSLSFWYHMYGSVTGSLDVEIDNGNGWENIWTMSGSQQSDETDSYREAVINLSSYSGQSKLRFVATSNGAYYGDIAIDDIYVSRLVGKTEVISKTISTVDTVAEFVNVDWNYDSSSSGNVKLELSVDDGNSWTSATNGAGLVGFTGGKKIKYKAIFEGISGDLALLDLNLLWSNVASPAPDITINSPLVGTSADVTPILDFSTVGGIAANIWYVINGGSRQDVCSGCSGNFNKTLYLQEGVYTINVYADNSLGVQKSDSVSFTIDMNGNYADTYSDDSQIWNLNGPIWQNGNVSYQDLTGGVVLLETFDDVSSLDDWTMNNGNWNVVGGEMITTSNLKDVIVTYNDLDLTAGVNYNISMKYMNADDDESGIIFRYKDAENFYKCSFIGATGNPSGNMEGLMKWEGGVATVFNNSVNDIPDTYNTITVSIVEDNITCYLNNVAVYNIFDNSWDGGKVGIFNNYDDVRNGGSFETSYDDFTIITWEDILPSFTSYQIKTLQNIVEILNVSWNDYLENEESEITVDVSTDNGVNWHRATNGLGLGILEVANELVYRVNYDADSTDLLSLLDLNIEWTHSASPAPVITISPVASTIKDTTPVLTASINGPADTFWYTINNGEKNIICEACGSGSYDSVMLLEEGDYEIRYYANNSIGVESNAFVSFEVNMNRNYFDTYLDSSQIADFDLSLGGDGNITYVAKGIGLFDNFDSGILSSDWKTYSTNIGRIGVRVEDSHSQSYSVVADTTGNSNSLNELITVKDFSGASSVVLNFWYRDWQDESQSVSDHVGHQNGDGVYFTCDGNQWHLVYDLATTSVPDGTWVNANIDIGADPDFCSTVDSNFAIKFTQYDNSQTSSNDGIAFDDINISIPGGSSQIISHPINVSQSIRGISDVSWSTSGTDVNNPIGVDISVDGGANWHTATNGAGLVGFVANDSLVYRVNFNARDNREMSLLDLNITWEEPPTINILYPMNNYVYNSAITKMNYTVSVSGSETLNSCWYTTDGGIVNTTVNCGEAIVLASVDGVNKWTIYADDSSGAIGSDTVQFIIDTAAPGIIFLDQSGNPVDEGSEFNINVNVTDSNTESVWIVIWENVVGGTSKFTGFLSNLFGDLFSTDVLIDTSYNLSHNYTVYANDTTGLVSNYTGNFDVLKMMFSLTNNPVYSDGVLPAYVAGHLGLSTGTNLANHPFNIWLEGVLIPLENLIAHGTYLSELNFTGQTDLFAGSLLENVSDAGGYLTLAGSNTTGSMTGAIDAGAMVDWGAADWTLLSGACSDTVNYYDGVAWGYSGTEDTFIDSANPNTNYGISNDLNLDTNPSIKRVLLKFDDIFGYGKNKIPYESSITSATMSTNVYVPGNNPVVYEVLEDWSESTATYNGRLPGQSWSSVGVAGSPSRTTSPTALIDASTSGPKSFDVTSLVSDWNNRIRENFGVVYNPGGATDVQMRGSEYVTAIERPRLDVTFSSTECAGVEVYYRTSQDKSVWSDWRQVFTGEEIVDDFGMSRYLDYKVVFGSFNGVVKPNLWDIKFNYTATVTDANGDFNYSFSTTPVFGTYPMNFTSGYRTLFDYIEADLKVQSGIDPVATFIWPGNNYWSSVDGLTIEYNATDANGDLASSNLFVDGVIVSTNQSVMINGLNEFDYTFTEGCHNVSIEAIDSINLRDMTPNRTICIDLVNPVLALNSPLHQSSYTVGFLNLSFTPQDNLDAQLNCNVTLDGINIYENIDYANGVAVNVSSGALVGGVHNWNVTCRDESGRSVVSETREFTISDTPPTVSLLSPTDGSVVSGNDINFTFFPNDNSGINICELFIDGSYSGNVTNPLPGKNSTILATGIADGFHDWSVTCTDLSSTATNSGNWSIGVDTTGPAIEIFNLIDNFISVDATPDFDVRITDAIDNELSCDLMFEGGIWESFNATSGDRFNFTSTIAFPDGINSWYLTCRDDSGYSTNSAPRNVDVREAPIIVINNLNETYLSSTDFSVFFTPSDNMGISSCSLYVNGILNETLGGVVNNVQNLIEPSGFANGIYNYYMTCSDGNGNVGASSVYEMTLDTVAPTLIPFFPLDEPVYAVNITFNFTANDEYSNNLNCSIDVDGVIVDSNIIFNNNTNVSRVISGITDGVHDWNFTCHDEAGNSETSMTYNFSRFTAPGVNLITPLNETWMNVSDFAFVYFPQDDEGFDKAELYLNGVREDTDNSVTTAVNNQFDVSLSDGVYDWYVKVTDSSLMPTSSETRRVYVDTAAPTLALGLPVQDTIFENNGVDFKFTITDNMDNDILCDVNVGGSLGWRGNVSSGVEKTVELLLSDGDYTYNINCSDEAGNKINSIDVDFKVVAPPLVELIEPLNEIKTTNSTINFSYKPIDDIGLFSCSMYMDSVKGETTFSMVPNVVNNFTVNGITEGVHNWSVECTDLDFNIVMSNVSVFTRDVTPPTMTLHSPEDSANIDSNIASVQFTWETNDNLDTALQCNLMIDGVNKKNNVWVGNGANKTESVSGLTIGSHDWNVTCWDRAGNIDTSETRTFNYAIPDFAVSAVTTNGSSFTEGESVLINATIENIGSADSKNVIVDFYLGEPLTGSKFETHSINILSGETKYLSGVLNADIGLSEIYVVVDYVDSFNEASELNNMKNVNVSVGAWQFFYGDVTGESNYTLSSQQGDVLSWSADKFNDGSIFMSDKDSSISWSDVMAFGYDDNLAYSVDDFDEVDEVMGMEGFSDSFENLFLDESSLPKATRSFSVFGKEISTVPVVQSTDNNNFETGVLWDMSDDTNGEFDKIEREDLIFVSKINKDAVGKYGTYDYEIRVPANLREYSGPGSEAVFYVEIY